jgi:threonine aldolase
VLVIDDDASVRESIVDLLSFLGHHVDEASNGADGIELFACRRHDVVMTDLRMPGLTGWDVIEQVRRIDPEARVVLCTASATSAVIERARLAELPVVFKPIRLSELQAVIRTRDDHFPRTGLICLENTHNQCGGIVLGEEDLASVRAIADRHGLPIHMDGARLFNAAVGLGVPVARLAGYADSVCFSLSKGLGCPVGSVLCGSRQFIAEARRYRKMLGGGMRQAGVLAAAGIYALDNMVQRLAEDHENARIAADGLAAIPGIELAPAPETNLLFFTVEGWDLGEFVRRLEEKGVLCFDEGGRIRWVTHYGIESSDLEEAVARLRAIMAAGA